MPGFGRSANHLAHNQLGRRHRRRRALILAGESNARALTGCPGGWYIPGRTEQAEAWQRF
jgi:hypothetical protein